MQGILLGVVLLIVTACLYKQLKVNIDELRASDLEDKLESKKAENRRLKAMLAGQEHELQIDLKGKW